MRPGLSLRPLEQMPTFKRPPLLPPNIHHFRMDHMQERLLRSLPRGINIHFHGSAGPVRERKKFQIEKNKK